MIEPGLVSRFRLNRVERSRIADVDFESLPFGKEFTDHMFSIDFEDGQWQQPTLMPYGDIPLSPATSSLHYGQAIFEGMKCNKDEQSNDVLIFRPEENAKRLNLSASRLGMPELPIDLFMEGLTQLVQLDRQWVPTTPDCALYMRPFMFATDPLIGVRPSDTYKFMIIMCPVGPYYSKDVRVLVADEYVRAFPGGTGYAKAAGNYAASMYPTMLAKQAGYDQVLWTDGYTHEYLEEIGTMNVFFVIDNVAHTPMLDGTILDGITRNSIIQLLRDEGMEVVERKINVKELFEANEKGLLQEAFGAGTAATVSHISAIGYKGQEIELLPQHRSLSLRIKQQLNDIKRGLAPDLYDWIVRV